MAIGLCNTWHERNSPRISVLLLRHMRPAARKETRLEETADAASTNSVHGGTVSVDRRLPPSWVVYVWNLVRTDHDLAIFAFLLSSLHQRKGQRQKIRVKFSFTHQWM